MTINIIDTLNPLGAFPIADAKDIDSVSSSQQVWYVDPIAGLDTNTGISNITALKTVRELNRRLRILTLPDYEIHILNDLPVNDPIGLTSNIVSRTSYSARILTRVFWYGQRNVVGSGTFTANGTSSTPASNLAPTLTDSGVADWTSNVGKTIVVTSGASSGFIAHILKNLGAGVARCSYWHNCTAYTPTVTPGFSPTTPPLSGDSYSTVEFTKVYSQRAGNCPEVAQYFNNFDFTVAPNSLFYISLGLSTTAYFVSCKTNQNMSMGPGSHFYLGNMFYVSTGSGIQCFRGRGILVMCAGYHTTNDTLLIANNQAHIQISNCMFQNSQIRCETQAALILGTGEAGFFDSIYQAISIGSVSTVTMDTVNVFGNGNARGFLAFRGAFVQKFATANVYLTGTDELSIDLQTTHIPPLVGGAVVPAAVTMNTWALLAAAPFNGTCIGPSGATIRAI
jgi:hypothetical protein